MVQTSLARKINQFDLKKETDIAKWKENRECGDRAVFSEK